LLVCAGKASKKPASAQLSIFAAAESRMDDVKVFGKYVFGAMPAGRKRFGTIL